MIRGVYPHGKRFRVRKYGSHIGVYDTRDEAEQVAVKIDNERKPDTIEDEKERHWHTYMKSKLWLIEHGCLNE